MCKNGEGKKEEGANAEPAKKFVKPKIKVDPNLAIDNSSSDKSSSVNFSANPLKIGGYGDLEINSEDVNDEGALDNAFAGFLNMKKV